MDHIYSIVERRLVPFPFLGTRFRPNLIKHIGEGTYGHVYSIGLDEDYAAKFQLHSDGSGFDFIPGNGTMDIVMNSFEKEVQFQIKASLNGISPVVYNDWTEEYTTIWGKGEQFILAEIQRQIPELEEYFHSWDCPLNGCSTKRPDMAYYIRDTFLHIEIDENGLSHEDCEDRLKELRFASQKKNHDLIRFNPDKTSDGDDECLKRSIQKYGDLIYRKNNSEWDKRIPVLIKCIRDAFERALLNADVDSFYRKQKLFF